MISVFRVTSDVVLPVTGVVDVVVSQARATLPPVRGALGTLVVHRAHQGGGEVALRGGTDELLLPLLNITSLTSSTSRPAVPSNGHQSLKGCGLLLLRADRSDRSDLSLLPLCLL